MVSILTRPWGRVQRLRVRSRGASVAQVSILTRPWGRVQQQSGATHRPARTHGRFNPHPPVGAGATRDSLQICSGVMRFQSSPARGGGCNATSHARLAFQSSPARGGGCNLMEVAGGAAPVSILTRPWGRVQPCAQRAISHGAPFQSSPARGGGCNATMCLTAPSHVSILTRPWGRVQRSLRRRHHW
jgi:hypothetical protein